MEYLHKDKERFKEAIDLTVYRTGFAPEVVEKDYYITLLLKVLAAELSFIVFKGGTSLSKCHRVIERFSEDVDLCVDTKLSQGQKKKEKETIVKLSEELGLKVVNAEQTRSRRDYNRYAIEYSPVYQNIEEVIKPVVLIETSYTTLAFPTIMLPVGNYVGEMLQIEAPDLLVEYGLESFEMKVQDIHRTLVDKVFAICDYYMQEKTENHSRHIYDIYKLLPLVKLDNLFSELIREVREQRKASSICVSAKDGINISEVLKEIVDKNVYKDDYQNLTEKLLLEKVPYEVALQTLQEILDRKLF